MVMQGTYHFIAKCNLSDNHKYNNYIIIIKMIHWRMILALYNYVIKHNVTT